MSVENMEKAGVKAGVVGWPIDHSLSPVIHQHWLKTYGIAGVYEKHAVAPENFADDVRALAAQGFAGVNVTMPHKQAAFALADAADKNAARLQAANVLHFTDGRIVAGNTDGFGFMENLRHAAAGLVLPVPVLILGAGGAARAIVASLADAGVKEFYIANRTADKIKSIADLVSDCVVHEVAWEKRGEILSKVGLLVNTTSLGMHTQPPLELDIAGLSVQCVVADIVYAPAQTQLLQMAKAKGCACVGGLGMLLYQAVPAFEAWFGRRPEVTDALRASVQAHLEEAG